MSFDSLEEEHARANPKKACKGKAVTSGQLHAVVQRSQRSWQRTTLHTLPPPEEVAMQSLASVEINCPIDEVFTYTNEKVAEWSLTVVEDEVIEDKNGVGTTFRCVTEEKGRRMEFQGVVTLWEPPSKSAISLTGKSFDIEAEYRFEDLNGRTRVTQESTVSGKGVVKIMFFLFGWVMNKQGCKAVSDELESLKEKLESGAGQAAG